MYLNLYKTILQTQTHTHKRGNIRDKTIIYKIYSFIYTLRPLLDNTFYATEYDY